LPCSFEVKGRKLQLHGKPCVEFRYSFVPGIPKSIPGLQISLRVGAIPMSQRTTDLDAAYVPDLDERVHTGGDHHPRLPAQHTHYICFFYVYILHMDKWPGHRISLGPATITYKLRRQESCYDARGKRCWPESHPHPHP
jgi:hypothetical protein